MNLKIKIAAVSYINTLPFVYGLEKTEIISKIDIGKYIPSECANKLINNEVDVGLIPVAAIPELKEFYVISDFCIAAKKTVDSVFLFSQVPINEIENIILDYQSKSSNNLTKVLSKLYWKITPNFIDPFEGYETEIFGKTAGVVIGNRALEIRKNFNYVYDLAEQWKNLTGNPFVFALWVSNKKLPQTFIDEFNNSLKFGVENIDKLENNTGYLSDNEFFGYLNESLNYNYTELEKQSLDLFLAYIKEL